MISSLSKGFGDKINVAGILKNSLSNGPGMRYVLFVQGCPHHCDGCHNKHTWSFEENRLMTIDEVFNDIKEQLPLIQGVTFSGGEPFDQPYPLYVLAKRIKEELKINVMSYTGYTYDEIKGCSMFRDCDSTYKNNLLDVLDILVDGKFEKDNTKDAPKWAGSANQKIYFFNRPTKESVIKNLKERNR